MINLQINCAFSKNPVNNAYVGEKYLMQSRKHKTLSQEHNSLSAHCIDKI